MTLYVLDTDHVSLFQREHPRVTQRVNTVNPETIAVTIITVEEQLYGRLNRIRRASSSDALISAYIKLRYTLNFFQNINVLDFNQTAFDCYIELRRQRIRIGTQDLRIAAILLSVNGILVTRNRRDFERVSGLIFEDWTI